MKKGTIRSGSMLLLAMLLIMPFSAYGLKAGAATEIIPQYSRVAAGASHALLIDDSGNVWSLGNNDSMQLGDGTTETRWQPLLVYHNTQKGKAVSVAAGLRQSLILTEDGSVLMWGYNEPGMTTQITGNAVAIAAGEEYCMAILRDGKAITWSDKQNQRTVETESGLVMTNVREISVGNNDTIVLRDTDGTVYQLDTDNYRTAVPVRIAVSPSITPESSSEGSSDSGSASSGPEGSLLTGAVGISAGGGFALALLSSGEVYTWGRSTNGVLGQGAIADGYYRDAMKVLYMNPVSAVCAGWDHALAMTGSGELFGWGNASQKRLDQDKVGLQESPVLLNTGISGIVQADCGNTFNAALTDAGEFYLWGNSEPAWKLALIQTLMRSENPPVLTENVGDNSITVKWDPADFYTGLATGFVIVYRLPNGTELKTQMLSPETSQITLMGLQAATNYTIKLQIHGRSGFVDETVPFIIQTLKDDGVTPTAEPTPTLTPTGDVSSSEAVSSEAEQSSGSSASTGGSDKLSDLFGFLLIGLVFIVLIAAITAILYVWRRIDRSERTGIKSVRIRPDDERGLEEPDADGTYEEDDDMIIMDDREYRDIHSAGSVRPEDAAMPGAGGDETFPEDMETKARAEDDGGLPGASGLSSAEEHPAEGRDISGPSKKRRRRAGDDDDDDFIIRKPGEPKV